MNVNQLLSVTHCNTLKDLNFKYNFQLHHIKFDGVITEELGTFESVEALVFRIEGLIKENINPKDLKVRVLKK